MTNANEFNEISILNRTTTKTLSEDEENRRKMSYARSRKNNARAFVSPAKHYGNVKESFCNLWRFSFFPFFLPFDFFLTQLFKKFAEFFLQKISQSFLFPRKFGKGRWKKTFQ